ncbi:hypothetical protein POM88_040518 [Heracleum sosnowskyi]|uniref:Ribosomal protein L35A n=1 Tax=Heracleum sosnowskyi TaxID=360622 RepID=A0AAD8HCB0_9APIA|nr:hypothetical protein POM88_040518 [Heracleum sosnowskyi]
MVKGRQGERVRLYVRGTILGYKRSKSNQYPNTSLVQIEGVNTKEEVSWYQGKRVAYIYKSKVKVVHFQSPSQIYGIEGQGYDVPQQYLSILGLVEMFSWLFWKVLASRVKDNSLFDKTLF